MYVCGAGEGASERLCVTEKNRMASAKVGVFKGIMFVKRSPLPTHTHTQGVWSHVQVQAD